MRIPIYSEDLHPQSGFKRIAKRVQKLWPGQNPISLSFARELLSKWLGYSDYHDVVQSSKSSSIKPLSPSESEVRTAIASAMLTTLSSSHEPTIAARTLRVFAEALPLQALVSFKHLQPQPSSDTRIIGPFNVTAAQSLRHTEAKSDAPPLKPGIKKAPRLVSPRRTFSPHELEAVRRVVQASGNLRDQSLFALIETGLRSHMFLSAKANLEKLDDSNPGFLILIDKQRHTVVPQNTNVLERYIRSEKLKTDGYLFPSSKAPNEPMSAREFSEIVKGWTSKVISDGLQPTAYSIRAAVIELSLGKLPAYDQLPKQVGHLESVMTQHYLTPSDTTLNGGHAPKTEPDEAD